MPYDAYAEQGGVRENFCDPVIVGKQCTFKDGVKIILGSDAGNKIGTAISEKLAFYGSTPVAQPTGSILSGISSLGLVGTPTLHEWELTNIQQQSAFMVTPLLQPFASTTNTIQTGDKTYFQYIGRVNTTKTTCNVIYYLNTSFIANENPLTDWAEISVWTGMPAYSGTYIPATLTRRGFVDCMTLAQFLHAPGILSAAITLTGVGPGDDLWVGTGSNGGTPAQFEALMIDRFGTGLTLIADGRSSTIGTDGVLLGNALTINSTVSAPAILVRLA